MPADLSRRVERLEKRSPAAKPFDRILLVGEPVPPGVDPERILWIELAGVEPAPRQDEERTHV